MGVRVFITLQVLEMCSFSLTCLDWQGIGKCIFFLKNKYCIFGYVKYNEKLINSRLSLILTDLHYNRPFKSIWNGYRDTKSTEVGVLKILFIFRHHFSIVLPWQRFPQTLYSLRRGNPRSFHWALGILCVRAGQLLIGYR